MQTVNRCFFSQFSQLKECQICKKKFTRTSNLTEHIKYQHRPNDAMGVKCPEYNCTSEFRKVTNFVVHYKKKHLIKCGCKSNKGKLCSGCGKMNSMKKEWTLAKQQQLTQQNSAKVEFLAAIGLCCRQNCEQKKEVTLGFKCLRNRYLTY